jgi:hypothetical protein
MRPSSAVRAPWVRWSCLRSVYPSERRSQTRPMARLRSGCGSGVRPRRSWWPRWSPIAAVAARLDLDASAGRHPSWWPRWSRRAAVIAVGRARGSGGGGVDLGGGSAARPRRERWTALTCSRRSPIAAVAVRLDLDAGPGRRPRAGGRALAMLVVREAALAMRCRRSLAVDLVVAELAVVGGSKGTAVSQEHQSRAPRARQRVPPARRWAARSPEPAGEPTSGCSIARDQATKTRAHQA